ncbi:ATP-grasp domain-containing protein [Nocardioides sp. HDW12B]|uniref:ATP-grasp domain-containing protein n=1 Tax=Nocardioides sp. HDW12B TaxID=2714939 RepID=UPI00140A31F2|nr:ATP-grasp domain-containing protein [Nocardioides sp. HDW12B]QIK64970.1 ATP-grasp domain-containing protein [Nocardioides sp. HDW12B]
MRHGRPNVLVTSAGRRGELIEILRQSFAAGGRRASVFTADASALSAAGLVGDGHHVVPRLDDPTYLDVLTRLCDELDVGHVVPTIDTELPLMASAVRHLDNQGTRVWVSGPETIALAQDKRLTNRFLAEHGLPHARQWDLDSLDDFHSLSFPVIAKPARGSSSVGLARVTSSDALSQLRTERGGQDYVVESVARGTEYTVDVLVDRLGTCRASIPRKRLEVRAGEVSKGVTVDRPDLAALAREVVTKLPDAFGVLNVQIFADATGPSAVIEVNARFGGGFPLTYRAGADLPGWLAQDIDLVPPTASLQWAAGLVMLRYDRAVFASADDLGVQT